MNGIYLLLGSNLGDRLLSFSSAVKFLESKGIKMVNASPIYETAPWGKIDQPHFLNMVIEVRTSLNPHQLLAACLQVETELGRKREIKWGARLIDIDILYYHNQVIDQKDLVIPHPGIMDRRFTLLPLCDLIPNEIHPITSLTLKELLCLLPNDESCKRTELHLTL